MFSRFIRIVLCRQCSFLSMAKKDSTVMERHILFIHSSVDGYLFSFLAIRNHAAINTHVHIFVNLCFQLSWV